MYENGKNWNSQDNDLFISDYKDALLFNNSQPEEIWESYDEYSSAIYEGLQIL